MSPKKSPTKHLTKSAKPAVVETAPVKGFRKKAIFATIGMIFFLLALGLGSFFGLGYFADGRFPSGTKISSVDISYKTPEGALKTLEREKEEYLNSSIKITITRVPIDEHDVPPQTAAFTPKRLGVNILTKETVSALIPFNSKTSSLQNFFFPKKPLTINPLIKVDEEMLGNELEKAFGLQKTAPIPANFYLEGQSLKIKEGENGYILDEAGLIKDLKKSAETLKIKNLKFSLKYGPSQITPATLEAQRENVKSALFHNFTLEDPVYSDNWDEALIKYPEWVIFEPDKEATRLKIDQKALNIYIDSELSKWLDRPADKVKISRDENGKVIFEGKGSDGLQIEREKLKEAIELAVQNRSKTVPIPVLTTIPELTISKDLQDLGIKERISVGHTSFYGSPKNRVHNIKTAAARFDGLLISPDATFSFNKNLGNVDGSTGYLKELVIKPEGTLPEYGGGVCQVSTTMYRAILFSGLPVIERNQHSYAVSYYSQILGHGLDATIYLGGPDLRFKNDTDGNVLVQTFIKDEFELYFVFYGTNTGRTVELEGPYLSNYRYPGGTTYQETPDLKAGQTKQQEKAHTGFDALWYRYVTNVLTGEVTKETISTHYKAIPAKILVGTSE